MIPGLIEWVEDAFRRQEAGAMPPRPFRFRVQPDETMPRDRFELRDRFGRMLAAFDPPADPNEPSRHPAHPANRRDGVTKRTPRSTTMRRHVATHPADWHGVESVPDE